jgi:DNA invertase Pin-like site-specific DNA recombinase
VYVAGVLQKSRISRRRKAAESLGFFVADYRVIISHDLPLRARLDRWPKRRDTGPSAARAGAQRVFREVASGARSDRAQLRRAIAQLEEGDVLLVMRLDRLARSTRDLLNTLAAITEKKAGFRSLGDAWADTTTPHGRLMLTVLGGLAEFERELIRVRTGDGRERAKARGIKLGRKPKLTAHQRREAIRRRDELGDTLADIARTYNVSRSTISRLTA